MSTESFMRAALEADLPLSIEGQRKLLHLLDAERARADAAEKELAEAREFIRHEHIRLLEVRSKTANPDPYRRSVDV